MSVKNVLKKVIEKLSDNYSEPVSLIETKSAHGGSINHSVFIFTTAGKFFLKTNSAVNFPGMFTCESKGIKLLRDTNVVNIPSVIHTGVVDDTGYLLLNLIESAPRASDYWEKAGMSLALLHKNHNYQFGLDHNNYIGSLRQSNTFCNSGVEFMVTQRYEPMLQMARQKNLITEKHALHFKTFIKQLPDLLPDEQPSLLHGDLWNGNIITGPDGRAWLIDPAVYYGYRETDLAMAKLFGGFDTIFFDSYNEAYPLVKGWQNRVELFQLYPLLVHLNLFGSGYLNDVMRIVKKYT